MCGIFAYIGRENASPLLLQGLSDLEYRGYDSAGIYTHASGAKKAVGPVEFLKQKIQNDFEGTSGIAHTRWATHGKPTEGNAHPHSDCNGRVWIAHNGIIENYKELKEKLEETGHVFKSETDSEVLAHLIEDALTQTNDTKSAILQSLAHIRGTYGLVVMDKKNPNTLFVVRMGSPIVLAISEHGNFISSDPSAVLRHTRDVLYLEDGECAELTRDSYTLFTIQNDALTRAPERIDWDTETLQKGGYDHFMMKEMMEIPNVLRDSARGRIVVEDGTAKLGGLESVKERLKNIRRIIIVGCGSAYYAGLVGKYMIEEHAGIPVEVEVASEFRYQNPVLDRDTILIAISQSGETADTLASIREAKTRGLLTLGIVNVVGSTIARETDAGVYNHAGPEIGVASTKAFISQLEVLALLTLFLGRTRNMNEQIGIQFAKELLELPKKAEKILGQKEEIKKCAELYAKYNDFLFIGRKYNFPIAYEGALKLKEVSYIHAEGYSAGEMKHGPLAMIDPSFPTIAIAPHDSVYEKTLSNIEEIRAREGRVLAIGTEGDEMLGKMVDDIIYIPRTLEMLSPILSCIPLQLFSYYVGTHKGYNVDRPRNLAKSVTVE